MNMNMNIINDICISNEIVEENKIDFSECLNINKDAVSEEKFINKEVETPSETEMSKLDKFLENEKINNRNENWNKLNNGLKIQKLHIFAEQYAKEHKISIKDIRILKTFFTESINKNKLQKIKDVIYDKNTGTIQTIPSLVFNVASKNFTLKNMDKQRVSTLKSLTPKK